MECDGANHYPINQGFAERFHDLALIDTLHQGGQTIVSLCAAEPRPMPIAIELMERHPLGSQLFFPLRRATGWWWWAAKGHGRRS